MTIAGQVADPSRLRLRLTVGYDGTQFHGWAAQPAQRTVAGELTAGLRRLLGPDVDGLVAAGRTDAGVHARGQVAHVDVAARAWQRVSAGILRRGAAVLPPDIALHACGPAPAGFDARFSALGREYTYTITTPAAVRDPLQRWCTVDVRYPLDVPAMQSAAARLLGEHDFAAYCRARPGASMVRDLQQFTWRMVRPGAIVATVAADAFCHGMVRSLVGACCLVGRGRVPVEWPMRVLLARQRDPRVPVAPPHGLVLERVTYPADSLLARRASQIRSAGPRSVPPTPFGPRPPGSGILT